VTDYVKQLIEHLREAGFKFERHGKGSHEIWRNPATGKSITITKTRFRSGGVIVGWAKARSLRAVPTTDADGGHGARVP
jgi:HicA-like toxin of HicAB toxin-antitoxin system